MVVKNSIEKNTALRIIELNPKLVSDNFEDNKELVKSVSNITSKQMINRVAGIITKLIKENRVDITGKIISPNEQRGDIFYVSCPVCGFQENVVCRNAKNTIRCKECNAVVADENKIYGDIIEIIS